MRILPEREDERTNEQSRQELVKASKESRREKKEVKGWIRNG